MPNTVSITKNGLQAIRCSNCGRALAFGYINVGNIEIKCPNCKCINTLRAVSPNPELRDSLSPERHHAVTSR